MQGKGFEPLNSQREQIAQTRTFLESAAFGQASLPLQNYLKLNIFQYSKYITVKFK